MEIRTKFDYNDTIFVVKEEEKRDLYGCIKTNWYVVETKVNFINIGYNGKDIGIRYTYNLYWEQDCFATEAEAQKECDRRNGKE